MANKHHNTNRQFNVSINLKVHLSNISSYYSLNDEQLEECISDFNNEISQHIREKLIGEYNEEITMTSDRCTYDIS
jgi:hypothetical protein